MEIKVVAPDMLTKSINWNDIDDEFDHTIWDRLTSNFWLDTKIALSNDLKTWKTLTAEEKKAVRQVFANLTKLDTIQGHIGADRLAEDARTPHEIAVFRQIGFMEEVHAKSYSSIFSTLCSTEEINEIFRWIEEDETMQQRASIILNEYLSIGDGSTKVQGLLAKAASVMLESFLFYSGFYLPLHFAANAKLPNTADIIRLILRDEGVHGLYIGYKYQLGFSELTEEEQEWLQNEVLEMALALYDLEMKWTEKIYDPLGLTERVKVYMRYNMNKSLQNLGMENMFSAAETRVEASIMASIANDGNEVHDFFSGAGSSYVIGKAEETTDDDWA